MALIRIPGTLKFIGEKKLWAQTEVAQAGGINPSTNEKEYYPTRIGEFTDCIQQRVRGVQGDRESKNYWVRGRDSKGKDKTIPFDSKYFLRKDPYLGR
jgi:hypothetical protein